jgi:hypothetical protein
MPAPYINWLASYPKSGNTWVRAFIEYYQYGEVDINHMDAIYGDERIYYFQAVTAQPYHTLDLYQWALIRPAALNMYLTMHLKKDKLILKTHNAYAAVGEVPLFPPLISGPSVYLVRDPVDVIPSFARHTGSSVNDMLMMMQDSRHAFVAKPEKGTIIGFLSSWTNHVMAWSEAPDTIVIKYEDLKANPEYWFTEILKQFGFEINKTKVLEAIEATSLEKLQEQERIVGFSEAGKNDVFFGGTQKKLTNKQISKVVDAFGDVMRKFGYLDEEAKHGSNN